MKKNLFASLRTVGLGSLTALALLPHSVAQAQASNYPNKPITIVAPFAAGTLTDILTRTVANKLAIALGQPVVAENKTGADFVGITNLISVPNVLVVGSHVPAKNLKELLALQKQKSFSYGSSGAGGSMHLSGEIYKKMAGVEMVHIPYKGTTPVINDIIGGRVEMMFCNLPVCLSLIKSGKLTALGVTSATRSSLLPDVPTLAEAGLPGFDVSGWFGLFAPKGTPPDIVAKLNAETVKILNDPQFKEEFLNRGAITIGGSSAAFTKYAADERVRWGKIIEEAKITLE